MVSHSQELSSFFWFPCLDFVSSAGSVVEDPDRISFFSRETGPPDIDPFCGRLVYTWSSLVLASSLTGLEPNELVAAGCWFTDAVFGKLVLDPGSIPELLVLVPGIDGGDGVLLVLAITLFGSFIKAEFTRARIAGVM